MFLRATETGNYFIWIQLHIKWEQIPHRGEALFWFHTIYGEWVLLAVKSMLRSDGYALAFIFFLKIYDGTVRP